MLLGAGFGYLVPYPALKKCSNNRDYESIYIIVTKQQLDDHVSKQNGFTINNETE